VHKAAVQWVVAAVVLVACVSPYALAQQAHLDDSNQRTPVADSRLEALEHGFPRVLVHEFDPDVSIEAYSKYEFVDAHGNQFPSVEKVQSQFSNSTRMLRHISARAYQQFNFGHCVISGGIAFESTTSKSQGGPQSDGCGIYAGHWMYHAGTPTRAAISAGTTTIPVASTANIDKGKYVVVYDAPAGSFKNAEHAKVTNVNVTAKTIDVQRGYKSNAYSHPQGAIVAQHVIGQGDDAELWSFNMSTQSPRDGNGKTFGEFYADWIGKNFMRYGTGTVTKADVAGIMFDADFYYELKPTRSDVDNNLVVDNGLSAGGTNWLGDGLDAFYQRVANRLPGEFLLAGVHDGRGYAHAHGAQMENWLDYGNGDFSPVPKYRKFDEMFTFYIFNMAEREQGPPLVHNLTKTPTREYPGKSGSVVNSNAPFRLGLATTLMADGYFGTHSELEPDAWWDEYAVDVDAGSPRYGEAIRKWNVADVRRHRNWLGQPLGEFMRIYDDAAFLPGKSLIGNGTFDANVNGWRKTNTSISRETGDRFEGAGALQISPMINFNDDLGGAMVKGPRLNVQANQPYTAAFALRSSVPRDIRIALGDAAVRLPVGTKWRRYVITLTPKTNSATALKFNTGREPTYVWVDSVYLFKGDANVFAREFEHGMVLANATASSRTIAVGSNFRRIKGTQDTVVNDGSAVTSVTLAPWDGILLVRKEGAGTGDGGGGGSGLIGDLVWRDDNGDGLKAANEAGWAGLTIKLRECGGVFLRSTKTDNDGLYEFSGLGAGDYEVEFPKPVGVTYSNLGDNDSDVDPDTGRSRCVKITSASETRRSIDAGLVPAGSSVGSSTIGDYVWHDLNGNGIQNDHEPGLDGVKVKLRDCNGIYRQTTLSNASGHFEFGELPAGGYIVQFEAPSGAEASPVQTGTDPATDSNPDKSGFTSCISVGNNDLRGGIDAGFMF
jgi:hypothetical protein